MKTLGDVIQALERSGKELFAKDDEINRLRSALAPFADIDFPEMLPDGAGFVRRRNGSHVTYGDIRMARELLPPNSNSTTPRAV